MTDKATDQMNTLYVYTHQKKESSPKFQPSILSSSQEIYFPPKPFLYKLQVEDDNIHWKLSLGF